jgi:hypothetical protein
LASDCAVIAPNFTGRAESRCATLNSAAYWSGPRPSGSPTTAGW